MESEYFMGRTRGDQDRQINKGVSTGRNIRIVDTKGELAKPANALEFVVFQAKDIARTTIDPVKNTLRPLKHALITKSARIGNRLDRIRR